jgi:hypothetical protein
MFAEADVVKGSNVRLTRWLARVTSSAKDDNAGLAIRVTRTPVLLYEAITGSAEG